MRTALALIIVLAVGIFTGYMLNDTAPPGWELYWHVAAIAFGIIFTGPAILLIFILWLLGLYNGN